MTDRDDTFTALSVQRARENVAEGGKPFACLLVRDGEVVVEATNHVAQTGDPTAHAEIRAIRLAAEQGLTDLRGVDAYVTAYPCPMCLGALYYAQPDRVIYAVSREEEGEHYEDGNRLMTLDTFYDEYAKPLDERTLRTEKGRADDAVAPFVEWTARHPS
ncbi:nucleoside deaminase [Frigoribacterium sp. CFBP9039]|uniref:nucleoside deaminase n=1 Tax=unclassified Frigoribacterium TaxID=2627005 RepID=UPI001783760B|nr:MULTISPECIES: nucleoside deaminase [unclassified Frigoribacterium]MBD8704551.1 nucleoside deaminase [Frigoribacterium sp. CFBP 13712]MDY0945653.1 nucleoside deaminase [Frigoribacterium sp. CFBP9039]